MASAELDEGPSEAGSCGSGVRPHTEARSWKDAIDDYTRAIVLEPVEPEFGSVGESPVPHRSDRPGEDDLSRGIDLDPEDDRSYVIRGGCRSRWCSSRDPAVADLSRAIELRPLTPSYYYSRGIVWQRLGDLARALEDLDEAVRLPRGGVLLSPGGPWPGCTTGPGEPIGGGLARPGGGIRPDPDTPWYREERGYSASARGVGGAAEDFANRTIVTRPRAFLTWAAGWSCGYTSPGFPGTPERHSEPVQGYFHWYLHESAGHGRDDSARGKSCYAGRSPWLGSSPGELDGQQLLEMKRLQLARGLV